MFRQIELPYEFDTLEPFIDAQTVETHYTKHHATYTKKLNEAAVDADVAHMEIKELLANLNKIEDERLRKEIRNNGGGFYNHNLYFSTLGKQDENNLPTGELKDKIEQAFGNFEEFKEQISELALSQFGSGWAWLSVTPNKELVISKSLNQDNPISLKTGNIPIFTIDVWEHAYYLKYKNKRAEYVQNIFEVINWRAVEENYRNATKLNIS